MGKARKPFVPLRSGRVHPLCLYVSCLNSLLREANILFQIEIPYVKHVHPPFSRAARAFARGRVPSVRSVRGESRARHTERSNWTDLFSKNTMRSMASNLLLQQASQLAPDWEKWLYNRWSCLRRQSMRQERQGKPIDTWILEIRT